MKMDMDYKRTASDIKEMLDKGMGISEILYMKRKDFTKNKDEIRENYKN